MTPTSKTTFTYSSYLPSWSPRLNTPLTTPSSQSTTREISKYEQWEEFFDGPKPVHETIEYTPYHWYTQQWWNCALISQPTNFDEDEHFDLFDYPFDYDSTIYKTPSTAIKP